MNQADLRSITNNYQDARLISLRTWKGAASIPDRDANGPYIVGQEGYDPQDIHMTPDEFVLCKSGQWLSTSDFFKLPQEDQRKNFVFVTIAEVMHTMANLPSDISIMRPGAKEAPCADHEHPNELNDALKNAPRIPGQP